MIKIKDFSTSFFLLLFLASSLANAQEYKVAFIVEGYKTSVDSIVVNNLRTGVRLKVQHYDTLNLIVDQVAGSHPIIFQKTTPYPNPSKGIINIPIREFQKTLIGMELYELSTGRILLDQDIDIPPNTSTVQLAGLAVGTYLLFVKQGDIMHQFRVIVTNNSNEELKISIVQQQNIVSVENTSRSNTLTRQTSSKALSIQPTDTISFESFSEGNVQDTSITNIDKDIVIKFNYISFPKIRALEPVDTSSSHITLNSKIMSNGGLEIDTLGVVWSTMENPIFGNDNFTPFDQQDSVLQLTINEISPSTEYFLRGYAKNAKGEYYTEEISVTTKNAVQLPSVELPVIYKIGNYSATVSASITDSGNSDVNGGICWSLSSNPALNDTAVYAASGIGEFEVLLKGLEKNTTYFLRSFAQNEVGITYSDEITFTTTNFSPPSSLILSSTTTDSSAQLNIQVTSDGGSPIKEIGICWWEGFYNIRCAENTEYAGEEFFSITLEGLRENTLYWAESYAKNEAGETGYSTFLHSFFTQSSGSFITMGNTTIQSYLSNSVDVSSSIISHGSSAILNAGFCYSDVNTTPSLNDTQIEVYEGSDELGATISSLTQNQNYFIRSFAINATDTAYGPVKTFNIEKPQVILLGNPDVASQTAKFYSEISSQGSTNIIERGIVWDYAANPDTASYKITNPLNSNRSFTTLLDDLRLDSVYYIRSYAINSVGLSYSEAISIRPEGCPSTITDIDGNNYSVIRVGGQCWMSENLKTTNFSDGSPIELIENQASWNSLSGSPEAMAYFNFSTNDGSSYGGYYTYPAVSKKSLLELNPDNTQGVCPSGWHIPSNEEWIELEMLIGNDGYAGVEARALKSVTGWSNGGNGIDTYGFNIIPAGFLYPSVGFQSTAGNAATIWVVDSSLPTFYAASGSVSRSGAFRNGSYSGHSVRCIKD